MLPPVSLRSLVAHSYPAAGLPVAGHRYAAVSMRPVRLELTGFTAFRERVVVDFEGVDLFALTGPTGAGKSSLIDAMTFALYGAVPRYDDRRLVAPVISQGRLEAKVRLDFSVDGRCYTAVRVVRRTGAGATTKEARLESGERVLAGDAAALTAAVERLVGLGFEQFTTCVVLPQGDFARFLHDTPKNRQDLLVRLLDLGVYRTMREQASARGTAAAVRADAIDGQLHDLAHATPEARSAVVARRDALAALRDRMDAAKPRVDELSERLAGARRRAAEAQDAAARLAALAVPADVADLAARLRAAARERDAAETAATAAEEALEAAEAARDELGDDAVLRAWREARAGRPALVEALADAEVAVGRAAAEEQARSDAVDVAGKALREARAAAEAVRRAHAAADLAAHLVPGQPCPVCAQPVAAVPATAAPTSLRDADAAVAAAEAELTAARRAATDAAGLKARADSAVEHARQRLAEVDARLRDAPDETEVARRLDAVAAAERTLAAARRDAAAARRRRQAAQRALGELADREQQAWHAFDAARDTVAALEPPPVDRRDLAAAWDGLLAFARDRAPAVAAAAAAAQDEAAALERERHDLVAAFRAEVAAAGVAVADGVSPRDACVAALSKAEADLERIDADLAAVARLRDERVVQARRAEVARALATHLSARGFERWLLDEALDRLVEGASATLRELSGGAYSLAVDEARTFAVVDHHNADEARPAKTLSGGETFLASLALALALADQVAELAAEGSPRLEAIFLDEGFGTLDAETLDTVAAAIEELGARGRAVGIVTHVRDLAERMPVRYEVRKDATSATVERVEL